MIARTLKPQRPWAARTVAGFLLCTVLAGCIISRPPAHQGLVSDPESGLLYGSMIDGALIAEPSFYTNRKIKVRIRNTSGDRAFDLDGFRRKIEDAYADKGFVPTSEDDFGLLIDLNVHYSGHVQNDLSGRYGFIGGIAGGLAGAVQGTQQAQAGGLLTGAALGTVAGLYVREDTYIIVASVTFGVIKKFKQARKKITFSRSETLKNVDDPDEDDKIDRRGFKRSFNRNLAVYAGGINVEQSQIAEEVRKRMVRIVGDIL